MSWLIWRPGSHRRAHPANGERWFCRVIMACRMDSSPPRPAGRPEILIETIRSTGKWGGQPRRSAIRASHSEQERAENGGESTAGQIQVPRTE
jgi:hypothetical protein